MGGVFWENFICKKFVLLVFITYICIIKAISLEEMQINWRTNPYLLTRKCLYYNIIQAC